MPGFLTAFVALAWLGFVVSFVAPELVRLLPAMTAIALTILLGTLPVVLLLCLYALWGRGSRAEARRLRLMLLALRQEQARLEAGFSDVEQRLSNQHDELRSVGISLANAGDDLSRDLRAAAESLHGDLETLVRQGNGLRQATAAARGDLALLSADLPKAHAQTRELGVVIESSGRAALEQAEALGARFADLAQAGEAAALLANGSAASLREQLQELERAAGGASDRLDQTLARTDASLTAARTAIDAQSAALLALVEQAQTSLARTGALATDATASRIDQLAERLQALSALLAEQGDTSRRLLAEVEQDLRGVDRAIGEVDGRGATAAAAIGGRLAELRAALAVADGEIATNLTHIGQGVERGEALLAAVDAVGEALARLNGPETVALQRGADQATAALATRLGETEQALTTVMGALNNVATDLADKRAEAEGWQVTALASLERGGEASAELRRQVGAAADELERLGGASNAALVDALLRVRDVARQSSEAAREALGEVIPETADRFAEAARERLSAVLRETAQASLEEVDAAAADALSTANGASQGLMRQLLAITGMAGAIEDRADAARAALASEDRHDLPRRAALLLDSLNSIAIDVAKLLSTEVTEAGWRGFLRGDRGIFVRRSLSLLKGSDAQAIRRWVDGDGDARESVGRYCQDFEGLLRQMLGTGDGEALAVTLLSSDPGRLYVALAQALGRVPVRGG